MSAFSKGNLVFLKGGLDGQWKDWLQEAGVSGVDWVLDKGIFLP